jgi:hypothetical protein
MTVKRDMHGRVWGKANYRWDVYRVVKGPQLGIFCVYYCLTVLHANSRKIMSLRTGGEELEHCHCLVLITLVLTRLCPHRCAIFFQSRSSV